MLRRKLLQVNSVDAKLIPILDQNQDGIIVRVYQQVCSIKLANQQMIHLVSQLVGHGPNRLVLDMHELSSFITLKPGMHVRIQEQSLWIDDQKQVTLTDLIPWNEPAFQAQQIHRLSLLSKLEARLEQLQNAKPINTFDNPFVIRSIVTFLQSPSVKHGLAILGLGHGSTPLGDDALVGHLLMQQFFGLNVEHNCNWILNHLNQTTPVSQEIFRDVFSRRYSATFHQWLKTLVSLQIPIDDESIMDLGGNSGKMILYSFYHQTCQHIKEANHEHILTHTS
jgi:hypothetical protein